LAQKDKWKEKLNSQEGKQFVKRVRTSKGIKSLGGKKEEDQGREMGCHQEGPKWCISL